MTAPSGGSTATVTAAGRDDADGTDGTDGTSGTAFLTYLAALADGRTAAGLRRRLTPRHHDDNVLDLASNDYLGLTRDPRVVEGGVAALRTWGGGSTGSRLVTGSTTLHTELEESLAAFAGAASALVFSSGYLANLAAVAALAGPDTLVVSDAVNHASIVDACRLSRSPVVVVRHRDVAAVAEVLAAREQTRALVVTDAVFSVDGDLAPLAALHAVARAAGAVLVADEAHSLGVVGPGGRGAAVAAGIADEPEVVRTLTLSKSLGAQGGAVLGRREVVDHLVDTARSFIFDTGLAPAAAGSALAAIRMLAAEPDRPAAARAVATRLAAICRELGLPATEPDAAVVAVPLGDPVRAVEAARTCLDRGVRVGCFRPPSVPLERAGLRLTARATLTDADLDRAYSAFAAVAD